MSKKRAVPEVRFRGFEGEWEERTLGELGNVAMNRRIFKHETSEVGDVPFYKIGTFGRMADAFISRALFEEYKLKYPYPTCGDLLISASGSIGKVVEYTGKDEYFQDSNIVWLQHDNKVANSFLKQFYLIVKWHGLEGSTIKRLYNSNILRTNIFLPNSPEQTRIGELFRNLDARITLEQRKHEKLQNLKKAMLEKMFPKPGATVPEVRFKGFEGEWGEKFFPEFVNRNSVISEQYGLPRIEYEDIVSGRGQFNKDIFAKESDKKGIIFESGDVLFGKLRPYLQNWFFSEFTGIAVGDWWVLRTNSVDNLFLFSLIQTTKYQRIANLSTGTKMPRSDWRVVSSAKFAIPVDPTEQTRIGEFFRNLDRLISLQQRRCEKLQNIKKAMLGKMFV